MFFACHFQEEHSSLDNKNYVESIFILYRIKYQKIKIDLTSPLIVVSFQAASASCSLWNERKNVFKKSF